LEQQMEVMLAQLQHQAEALGEARPGPAVGSRVFRYCVVVSIVIWSV
jgi:hypothetical protein